MDQKNVRRESLLNRRGFLSAAAGAVAAATAPPALAATGFTSDSLRVWACGGLSEAFVEVNRLYKARTGVEAAFTGAFAAALGKSLMGNAVTDVFAGRVLALAKKLRKAGKMVSFQPLCFTRYVLVTPVGNPAGISDIKDLAREGVRVVLAPKASPPGGEAATVVLKKAGVIEQAMKNAVILGSCVQRTMKDVIDGKGDVSIVEFRLTRMREFKGRVEIIPIPEKYFPPPPLTFTIGIMKDAPDKALARHYIDFVRSEEGQRCFDAAGFIPAISDEGRRLTEKLGVKDV